MRTYEDTFSGEKIYPGKVLFTYPPQALGSFCGSEKGWQLWIGPNSTNIMDEGTKLADTARVE